jgi:hypothetical protein
MGISIPIISEAIGLIRTWIEGKQKKQAATDDRAAEIIRQEGNWDNIMAQGAANSWKDEWLTLLFSIPLVLAFFPSMVPIVAAGFEVLDKMPGWYKYTIGVIVAASFGVRSAINAYKAWTK